jgi:hypothetical protein
MGYPHGRATAIPLGRASRRASRDQPGRRGGNASAATGGSGASSHAAGRPYSVLLQVGFALPPPLPGARCALAAPFHPCLPAPTGGRAVCFLWHSPWGRPRRPLAGTAFPWSPDFPLPPDGGSGRPAVWHDRDATASGPLQAWGALAIGAGPVMAGYGRIAQLVEQLTLNQRVQGSSPCAPTNQIRYCGQ